MPNEPEIERKPEEIRNTNFSFPPNFFRLIDHAVSVRRKYKHKCSRQTVVAEVTAKKLPDRSAFLQSIARHGLMYLPRSENGDRKPMPITIQNGNRRFGHGLLRFWAGRLKTDMGRVLEHLIAFRLYEARVEYGLNDPWLAATGFFPPVDPEVGIEGSQESGEMNHPVFRISIPPVIGASHFRILHDFTPTKGSGFQQREVLGDVEQHIRESWDYPLTQLDIGSHQFTVFAVNGRRNAPNITKIGSVGFSNDGLPSGMFTQPRRTESPGNKS